MENVSSHIDHRQLGRQLALFHQQEEGPGMVFWHPRGFALWRVIEDYIRKRMRGAGFAEIRTPQILARALWEKSGHWEKFADHMFAFTQDSAKEEEGCGHRMMALKPMSCPGHIQIFNADIRSYRELPLRYAEFGACHRNEPSGALQGLMRTRAFVQDDAHIFCTEEQIVPEVARFCDLLRAVYADFGFDKVRVGFSTRPLVRAGDDPTWDRAEASLEAAAKAAGLDYRVQPGEGAFYGPKLEFILEDARGRAWQCGTIQLDFVLPERLDALYVDASGARLRPAMIHHAVLGSLERFIAMLLEHYQGVLPLWLAPEQIVVASITPAQNDYAIEIAKAFVVAGFRVALDTRAERLPRKILDAREAAIPVLAVVGAKEAARGSVALRWRDGEQRTLPLAEATALLTPQALK